MEARHPVRKVIAVVRAIPAWSSVGQWRWRKLGKSAGLVMGLDEVGEEEERIKSDPEFLL